MALNFEAWKNNLPQPKGLDMLLGISVKVARSYPDVLFMRIDAYIVKGLIYLGECTFHPGGGNMRFLK